MTLAEIDKEERGYKSFAPYASPYREDRSVRRSFTGTASIHHFVSVPSERPGEVFASLSSGLRNTQTSSRSSSNADEGASRVGDLVFAALPAVAFPLAAVGAMAVVIAVREGAWAYAVPGSLAAIGFSLIGLAASYAEKRMRHSRQ